ncbi:amyloid-beta A4 precursor protein-binding family B member 3-like [Lampris incognitus]|uniref:amyloid-beta A4 precursor protein-binding family B member 3-like n=1 Tax=Lampris incognitus TaxID=2546036 RepID=UPI0024B5A6BD|nr:amyloid-beta A4 precursor protein-binding family B member 3-like [Lampris incognitus]
MLGGGAMMGKDYTLAIIIVNYDDNIWSDQSLAVDPDLPSGWRVIRDSTGTYYWHVPTGATQWHHPCHSSKQSLYTTQEGCGSRPCSSTQANGKTKGPVASVEGRSSWHEDYLTSHDPDAKCFAVRSLGWLEVPEEELTPGRSSLAVNNVIQQLSHCKNSEEGDTQGAWGEGGDMMLVLKKDTLSLMDPSDHTLLHCQAIINIRVWGVGCNNGSAYLHLSRLSSTCILLSLQITMSSANINVVGSFFDAFEKIAKELEWPENRWTLLIQSVLEGRAQGSYATLDASDSRDYDTVWKVVVAVYEVVPEAY